MLNLANLPDLAAVKEQVDRIDATVQASHALLLDIHAVFQGISTMLPGVGAGTPMPFDPTALLDR